MPRSLILLLCVLAGYWALLIHNLGAQWSLYEQYNYGWSVPILCAYLIWRKFHYPTDPPTHRSTDAPKLHAPRSTPPAPPSTLYTLRSPLSALLLFSLLLYAPTRFFHEANPTW